MNRGLCTFCLQLWTSPLDVDHPRPYEERVGYTEKVSIHISWAEINGWAPQFTVERCYEMYGQNQCDNWFEVSAIFRTKVVTIANRWRFSICEASYVPNDPARFQVNTKDGVLEFEFQAADIWRPEPLTPAHETCWSILQSVMDYEESCACDTSVTLTTEEVIKYMLVDWELQFAMERDPDAMGRVGL